MNKLLFSFPILAILAACVAPITNTDGKPIPIVIQTPTPVINPVIIDISQKNTYNNTIFVCKIKPFTQTFQSEHENRGKAKLNAQKQCLVKNHEMFCQEKDIECKEYK